jgi:hypothetical protein
LAVFFACQSGKNGGDVNFELCHSRNQCLTAVAALFLFNLRRWFSAVVTEATQSLRSFGSVEIVCFFLPVVVFTNFASFYPP